MRQFYLANEIWPLTANFTWIQHVELLAMKKSTERRKLERLVITKGDFWGTYEIQKTGDIKEKANRKPE